MGSSQHEWMHTWKEKCRTRECTALHVDYLPLIADNEELLRP